MSAEIATVVIFVIILISAIAYAVLYKMAKKRDDSFSGNYVPLIEKLKRTTKEKEH